jgi:hypothetical protein
MTNDLLTWLRGLSADDWDRRPAGRWEDGDPADPSAVDAAESALARRFPDDYRGVVLASNHAALTGPNESINFEPIEGVASLTADHAHSLRDMVVVGDNGGGAVYFYDPNNALGHGQWALYWVNLGDLALDNARLAGKDLTDALHRIANGVSYFNEPALK